MAGPVQKDHKGRLATGPAQDKFLELLQQGWDIGPAAREVGRTPEGAKYWRQDDGFDRKVKAILARRAGVVFDCPDFPEFCEEFLGQKLFAHQLRWWDILCGRAPRDLHPSMTWSAGDPQMLLLNVPPGHGKSTTLTVNLVTWLLCKDPNVRIVIVSATQRLAKQFLGSVKNRLSHDTFSELQHRFGPSGGFKATAESWTQTEIFLGGKSDGEKDPNVQAIGMGSQIYGTRADFIIVDDAVLLDNAHRWEDQIDWITQEVVTRLPESEVDRFKWDVDALEPTEPKLIVVGTRVATTDLYSKLRDEFRDEDDNSVFTYFAMPAVLEYADDPRDWVTLWPETVDREGKVVPKWSGLQLKKRREKVRPSTWAMVYQQLDVSGSSIFPEDLVRGSVQSQRMPGAVRPGFSSWERENGMRGLYTIMGVDPATSGFTGAVCLGVDRASGKIWLIDAFNKNGVLPRQLRELIQSWTERYALNEVRVEINAYQRAIVQDDDLRSYLFSRGVILKPHHTGAYNKRDSDFGVASMTTLFEPDAAGVPTLLLPNINGAHSAVAELVEQFLAWQPNSAKGVKTDILMACWIASIRARELIFRAPKQAQDYMPNPFLSRGRAQLRQRVNLNDIAHELMMEDGR